MKLDDEKRRLVEDNIDLAYKRANELKRRYYTESLEDLISDCFLGLSKAARLYDSEVAAFSTFAYVAMENEVRRRVFRHVAKWKNATVFSALEIENNKDGSVLSGEEYAQSQSDSAEVFSDALVDLMVLTEEMGKLSDREILVIDMWYFKELKQEEIAEFLGVSQPHVSRLLGKIQSKMRSQIER